MSRRRALLRAASVWLLIGVFACCALVTAVFGAGVLNKVSARADASYETRTSLLYISQKLRACAGRDAVRVEAFGDSDALVLSSAAAGAVYETWIYTRGGILYELTIRAGATAAADGGQPVTAVQALYVDALGDGLFAVRVVGESAQASVRVAVQGEAGV